MKDPAVRSVSYAGRGLWIDMLCLMHESDRRGYLQHATGKPVTQEQLARMTGGSPEEVSRLLQDLKDSGVVSCTEHGTFFCRRMVRDEMKRQKCVEAGRLGGNPTLKGEVKGHLKGEVNRFPTPSSSSSSSSSKRGEEAPPDSNSEIGDTKQPTVIEYFERRYTEILKKPVLLRAEDVENSRALVGKYGRVDTLVAIDRYFKEADDFTQRKGYPFYLFFKQAPAYFAGAPAKSNPDQANSPPPTSSEAWRLAKQGPDATFHEIVRRAAEQVGWEKIQDEDEHTRSLAEAKFYDVYQWIKNKHADQQPGKKMR